MIKNWTTHTRWIVPLAFTAAISLALGHAVDLGEQTLGSGPVSTAAVIGDLAGLLCCVASVVLGLRLLRRAGGC
ncbi:MAG TPA: hypothetical protein VHZ54_10635 [Solirubrobacterales bacterium]|jgi:hypothetical protein|nr:hypothetical protein [Solirubrobacterales bacterium]